jgi:hypothetical protein
LKDEIDGDRRKMLTSVGVGRSRPVFFEEDDGRRSTTPYSSGAHGRQPSSGGEVVCGCAV